MENKLDHHMFILFSLDKIGHLFTNDDTDVMVLYNSEGKVVHLNWDNKKREG